MTFVYVWEDIIENKVERVEFDFVASVYWPDTKSNVHTMYDDRSAKWILLTALFFLMNDVIIEMEETVCRTNSGTVHYCTRLQAPRQQAEGAGHDRQHI